MAVDHAKFGFSCSNPPNAGLIDWYSSPIQPLARVSFVMRILRTWFKLVFPTRGSPVSDKDAFSFVLHFGCWQDLSGDGEC